MEDYTVINMGRFREREDKGRVRWSSRYSNEGRVLCGCYLERKLLGREELVVCPINLNCFVLKWERAY